MQNLDNTPKLKLLAPAGNIDSLISAVKFGADVVYFGLNKFNARMKADNFNEENLEEWTDYCHIFGTEVFVAINTCIKNNEFFEAAKMIAHCFNCHVDGLILTDVGLIAFAKKYFPGLQVTLSTQQNVHNLYGASMAQKLKCDRVVLSRETPLCDIKTIFDNTTIELEMFCHGALCVSLSGQCLFSSIIDSNSGNRGLCAQPCRQKYTSFDKNGRLLKNGYLLSPKDICQLSNLKRFADCGVRMLKIEGRNRRSQYVAQTVKTYRTAISNDFCWDERDIENLKSIYNRGDYTEGYLTNNDNIIYPQMQGHKGVFAGKIINRGKDFYLKSNRNIVKGDSFKVVRNGEEIGNGTVLSDIENNHAKISVNCQISNTDSAYITTSIAQLSELDSYEKKIPVFAEFVAKQNTPTMLTIKAGDCSVTEIGAIAQPAINAPLSKEAIAKQISKTGDTCYTISEIVVDSDDIYLPISALNMLRRTALSNLTKAIIKKYHDKQERPVISKTQCDAIISDFIAQNRSESAGQKAILLFVDEVTVKEIDISANITNDGTTVVFRPKDFCKASFETINNFLGNAKYFLDLPNFATSSDLDYISEFLRSDRVSGIVANNLYAIELAIKFDKKIILGLGLNIFNDYSLSKLKELAEKNFHGFVYSAELSIAEIDDFSDQSGYIFVAGRLCLMTFAHCPAKVNLGCTCENCKYNGDFTYIDKTKRAFSVCRRKVSKCYWELYNCSQLFCGDKIMQAGRYMLFPDAGKTKKIYEYYCNINKGKFAALSDIGEYTTGHLFKKVK